MAHPISAKLGFCRKMEGVRFKESAFWVQKVHSLGVLYPPQPLREDSKFDKILCTRFEVSNAQIRRMNKLDKLTKSMQILHYFITVPQAQS